MSLQTNTTTATPAGADKSMRFELPSLEFKFGSLTDGTDIPPPPEEEAVPTPPETPNTEKKQPDAANGKADTASPQSQLSSISTGGTKRRIDDAPASPTSSTTRPGSIRRLFSRGLLNSAYTNGEGTGPDSRPQSRSGTSITDTRKAKRSSGWFGRLRSNDGPTNKHRPAPLNGVAAAPKSASPLSPPITNEKLPKTPTGPPPPMIPELSELNSKLGIQNDNSFGSDLFKDIK